MGRGHHKARTIIHCPSSVLVDWDRDPSSAVRLIVPSVGKAQGTTYCLEIPRLFRQISARLFEFSDHGPDASLFDPLPPASSSTRRRLPLGSGAALVTSMWNCCRGSMSRAVGWH